MQRSAIPLFSTLPPDWTQPSFPMVATIWTEQGQGQGQGGNQSSGFKTTEQIETVDM